VTIVVADIADGSPAHTAIEFFGTAAS